MSGDLDDLCGIGGLGDLIGFGGLDSFMMVWVLQLIISELK